MLSWLVLGESLSCGCCETLAKKVGRQWINDLWLVLSFFPLYNSMWSFFICQFGLLIMEVS